jgi:hypothetical protein
MSKDVCEPEDESFINMNDMLKYHPLRSFCVYSMPSQHISKKIKLVWN